MPVRHTEQSHSPVSIDAEFIRRLRNLVDIARSHIIADIASRTGINADYLKSFSDGSEANSEKERNAISELRRLDSLKIKIRYNGTKHFTTSSFDEAINILEEEYGNCDQFDMDYGYRYDTLVGIDLDDKYDEITYNIIGERTFVDDMQRRVTEFIRESKPNYWPLYSRSADKHLSLLAALSLAVLFIMLAAKFRTQLGWPIEAILPLSGIPFFFSLVFLTRYIQKQYRKTFPFIQIEFGNQKRRRDGSKSATAFLVAGIFLPIVLSIIGF
ncbi:hypothetical protein [uncultured Sphingomonas sp.]|uniref:hypothetical protein n=1 Tax=uncultured Sphingomonas sp. TaxID=158754 RepID=UPI00258BE0BD|nr:hypothetical protein [uncultured Sphingomonas sp.]